MTEGDLALPAELLGSTDRQAVYRCYSDQGELLYLGTSGHLGRRLAAHAEKAWFVQVRGITLEWYPDEFEALNAERRAIHVEHPKFNVQHRNTRRPKNAKGKSRRPRPPASVGETLALAAKMLAEEPGISGSELGRRLGVSDGRGRQLLRKLSAAAPVPQAGSSE